MHTGAPTFRHADVKRAEGAAMPYAACDESRPPGSRILGSRPFPARI